MGDGGGSLCAQRSGDFWASVYLLVRVACMVFIIAAIFPWRANAEELQFIDAHSPIPASVSMDTVLSLMDRAGVSRALVGSFGDPQVALSRETRQKHWATLRDYASKYPDRFTLAIGLKGTGNREGDPASLQLIRRQAASPKFGALAEVLVVHAKKGPTLPEMFFGLEHSTVQEARAIALKRGWPLILHIEFGHAQKSGRYDPYMRDLETLLDQNSNLPVILSHMGQLKPAEVSRLISAHDNLYFLTSIANTIVIAAKGKDHPWTDLFSRGAIGKDWEALMIANPDRFVFAIDSAIKPDWSDRYVQQVELWRKALQKLPATVGYAIARGNAERLWRLSDDDKPSPAAPAVGPASTVTADLGRSGTKEFLTEAEISETVIGNTLSFMAPSNGQPLFVYFAEDGRAVTKSAGSPKKFFKQWFFDDKGMLCRTFGPQDRKTCTRIGTMDAPDKLILWNNKINFEAVLLAGERFSN